LQTSSSDASDELKTFLGLARNNESYGLLTRLSVVTLGGFTFYFSDVILSSLIFVIASFSKLFRDPLPVRFCDEVCLRPLLLREEDFCLEAEPLGI